MSDLSSTASMVLLLCQDVHSSRNAKRYLKELDLEPGADLFCQCKGIWPHYDKVIRYRKTCILDAALGIIRRGVSQVVIFASGLDALSLELTSRCRDVAVYEVDISNMGYKRDLIRMVAPHQGSRIHFMQADLRDAQKTAGIMARNGFDFAAPAVIILEGISYYLSVQDLWSLVSCFKKGMANHVLLEYMVRQEDISKERSHIVENLVENLKKLGDVPMSRYDTAAIQSHLGKLGGKIAKRYTLKDIEAGIESRNIHFKTRESGWIEICHCVV